MFSFLGSENSPAELDVSPLDGIDVEPSSPDGSDEATSYEAKLVAMSGLHAELLELNEQLQNDLLAKDRTIHHLRNEINVLRGPLPGKHEASYILSLNCLADNSTMLYIRTIV